MSPIDRNFSATAAAFSEVTPVNGSARSCSWESGRVIVGDCSMRCEWHSRFNRPSPIEVVHEHHRRPLGCAALVQGSQFVTCWGRNSNSESACETCGYFTTGPESVPVLLRQRNHARDHHQHDRATPPSTTSRSLAQVHPTIAPPVQVQPALNRHSDRPRSRRRRPLPNVASGPVQDTTGVA